jgi:hypothetical protein
LSGGGDSSPDEGDGDEEQGVIGGESGGGADGSLSLLELAFTRASPRAAAEVVMQSFMALYAAGRVVPEKARFAV